MHFSHQNTPAPYSSELDLQKECDLGTRTGECWGVLVGKVHQNAVKLERFKMSPKLPQIPVVRPAPQR